MKNVAISLAGPFVEAIRAGFAAAGEAVRELDKGTVIAIVPSKKHISGTVTEEFLGRETCSELVKKGRVQLDKNYSLHLETELTLPTSTRGDVLLGLHVDVKTIKKAIQRNPQANTVIYVPWLNDEFEAFVKEFGAAVIEVADPRPAELRQAVDDYLKIK